MLRWPNQFHCPGFSRAANHTAAAPHAFFSINICSLLTEFGIVLHLGSSKLTSLYTGFTGAAPFWTNGSFETAFCQPFPYFILLLPKQGQHKLTTAPMTIAKQNINCLLVYCYRLSPSQWSSQKKQRFLPQNVHLYWLHFLGRSWPGSKIPASLT